MYFLNSTSGSLTVTHDCKPTDSSFRANCRFVAELTNRRSLLVVALCAPLLIATQISHAFDDLTPAQELIYERDHLIDTDIGQALNYRYKLQGLEISPVDDLVKANIERKVDEIKRDIKIDFLSGEHRMILPAFNEYRGNPIIIAMLEYSAQFIGRETGGGTLYFRNRIRDGLAGDLPIETSNTEFDGQSIDVQTISFKPFETDAKLALTKQYKQLVYSISLSEDLPGGVLEIRIQSKDETDKELMTSILTFENLTNAKE